MSVHYFCLVCAMLIWIFQVQITACSFSLYGRGQPMGGECYQRTHPQLPGKYSTWCGAYAHECCILQRWPTPQNETLHYCVLQSEERWKKLNLCSLTGQINQSFLKGEKSSQNCENCKNLSWPARTSETVPLSYNQTAHCANQGSIYAINEHCKAKPWCSVIICSRFNNWEINWI